VHETIYQAAYRTELGGLRRDLPKMLRTSCSVKNGGVMEERTTCCLVGAGPAGMVLGLLLARSGVEVTVLEKHGTSCAISEATLCIPARSLSWISSGSAPGSPRSRSGG